MKAVLHINNAAHQKQHVTWMIEGLNRHGVQSEVAEYNVPTLGDFAVIWGWKQPAVISRVLDAKLPILVMERAHLQPRMEYTSLGWNGLARRGLYPRPTDAGERWRDHWGQMNEWRSGGEYALLCGQVRGDASLHGLDFPKWAAGICAQLIERGEKVLYRPHPRNPDGWCPHGADMSTGTLDDDLAKAKYAVTYSSTVGVEAVLAGVPTITYDEGSMAYDVASHSIDDPLYLPDREAWTHALAWCQWNENEIRSGEAWEALKTCGVL